VHVPSFVIDSLGGLFAISGFPLFFAVGFVQYFSNMPSLSHFARDRRSDSCKTPLRQIVSFPLQTLTGMKPKAYLSEID
jgi:hypothetical protein